MSHFYLEFDFKVTPPEPGSDVLMAQLGAVGFESFMPTDDGVLAYIQKSDWHEELLHAVEILDASFCSITHTHKEIPPTNWNEDWEKNFSPITVGDQCMVRAPFHEASEVRYDIVIEPKMSFGTGHHQTTHMMLEYILAHDFEGQNVLDMGAGTAVLAILAMRKGAEKATAIDIDPWCVENATENAQRNGVSTIEVQLGGAEILPKTPVFHSVIANINRNILLEDMASYVDCLLPQGLLFLSGFYKEDLPAIIACCSDLGVTYVDHRERDRWVAAKFVNL